MNSNKGKDKFLVVYQITNLINGMIYIGAHTTYNKNDKYMGSSKQLKEDIKKLGRENFKKEILCECSSKEEMMKKEAELVTREFCHRPDTYNRHVGGSDNFTMDGMLTVINPDGGYMKVYNDDPRWLSGELKSMMNGTIMVKDKEGNGMRISKNDPRYLSGELAGIVKGLPGSCGMKNKKHTDEAKNKVSVANMGNTANKGKSMSEEQKEKIRISNSGKIQSEEQKYKRKQTWLKKKFAFMV